MELRTTLIAMILGLIIFTAAISTYGFFIEGYNIDTSGEFEPVYDDISRWTNDTLDIMGSAEDVAKEVQMGDASTSPTDPQINLWTAAANTFGMMFDSYKIIGKVVNRVGYRLGFDNPIYFNALLMIIVVIIAFTIASAVLRQKI